MQRTVFLIVVFCLSLCGSAISGTDMPDDLLGTFIGQRQLEIDYTQPFSEGVVEQLEVRRDGAEFALDAKMNSMNFEEGMDRVSNTRWDISGYGKLVQDHIQFRYEARFGGNHTKEGGRGVFRRSGREFILTLDGYEYFMQRKEEVDNWRPASNITDATWEEYKDMYTSSPLCSKEEITLWSCETSTKIHSLCSSTHITRKAGYIQYRVSKNGQTIFTFPNSKTLPFGLFSYNTTANGSPYIVFSNGGYEYRLIDQVDRSEILVTQKKSPHPSSQISCNKGNQTFEVNYTERLIFDAGIWSNY
jgi:hypothetical protein